MVSDLIFDKEYIFLVRNDLTFCFTFKSKMAAKFRDL